MKGELQPEQLVEAFWERLPRDWSTGEAGHVLVALSGGLDSTVLLHLLRFGLEPTKVVVEAAHFDHAMRVASEADALWVKGLCRAWEVPLHLGRTPQPLSSEDEARRARYDFLLRVKGSVGADWLLTAHHGDDQAETVLFRIFRGTGLAGLAGIPARRSPGILRPLLSFSREELAGYARHVGIRHRADPSNADLSYSRNVLRKRILPQVEETVAPGARRSLRRLARLARGNEVAWKSIMPRLLETVVREESGATFVVRSSFLAYHPAVQGRLLRDLLKRWGLVLDEAGTRRVLEFTRGGASGRSLELPGGLRIQREFDRFRIEEARDPGENRFLTVSAPDKGSGTACIGGRPLFVRWGRGPVDPSAEGIALPLSGLRFPLRLRGWFPGDRILLSYGSKKLKKLLAEARVPAGERKTVPVLVDGEGSVLWVAGVAVSAQLEKGGRGPVFSLEVRDDDER